MYKSSKSLTPTRQKNLDRALQEMNLGIQRRQEQILALSAEENRLVREIDKKRVELEKLTAPTTAPVEEKLPTLALLVGVETPVDPAILS